MAVSRTHHDNFERDEARERARGLIGERGWHGAVDACLRNGWDGVLTALLNSTAVRPPTLTRPAPRGRIRRSA